MASGIEFNHWAAPSARRPRRAHAAISCMAQYLLRDERPAARALALEHLEESGSRLCVFADLLHPAQELLADLWYRSRIDVFDEGRAAETVLDIVRRLPPTPQPAPVPHDSHCLLAALPTERHTLGLEMLAAALEDEGWRAEVALGQEPGAIVERASASWPRFVGLTVGYLGSRPALLELVRALHGLRLPVLVGGPAFNRAPHLWELVGADARAPDLRVGLVLARRTLRTRAAARAGAA
jgi:methanogenic corrinoid protein MtbC1